MSRRWLVVTVGLLLLPVLTAGVAYGGPSAAQGGAPCEETMKPPPPRCANLDCSDPMFTFHPPRGSYVSAHCAQMPIPLHYYDGEIAAVAGPANLAALGSITAGSGYHPLATQDGNAIAALVVADFRDTGVGPYREISIGFPVNERRVTVSTRNPYAFLSETLNPENRVWFHKLILSELMPIDWGRELLGYDKNPVPQAIDVRMSPDDTTFAATDPAGNPVVSGRFAIDTHPKAQAEAASQVVTAPHVGELLKPLLRRGGLVELNAVSPDVLRRGDALMKSHILARAKSALLLGPFGPQSVMTVNPHSDFGAALTRIDFRPVVSGRVPVRMNLDMGFAS